MALYTEYGQALNLQSLIVGLVDIISTITPEQFTTDYINLYTCSPQGLDNWGIILNTSRNVYLPSVSGCFGFELDSTDPTYSGYPMNLNDIAGSYPLNGGTFYDGSIDNARLDDIPYRLLLILTYSNLNCNMSIFTMNNIINAYYQSDISPNLSQHIVVTETAPMQLTYTFSEPLLAYEETLFNIRGVLPTPMATEIIIINP